MSEEAPATPQCARLALITGNILRGLDIDPNQVEGPCPIAIGGVACEVSITPELLEPKANIDHLDAVCVEPLPGEQKGGLSPEQKLLNDLFPDGHQE